MFIEDLILTLTSCTINSFDLKIVNSFSDQIYKSIGFTEKQANLAVSLLKRQKSKLNLVIGADISPFLENPKFRFSSRTINYHKLITIIPHIKYKKAIKVQFPYSEVAIEQIKKGRSKLFHSTWDQNEKSWIFDLSESSILLLMSIFNLNDFHCDEEFLNYVNQIKNIQENIDSLVPMLAYQDQTIKIINAYPGIPQIPDQDLVKSLFFARNLGISTWDDSIYQKISEQSVDPLVLNFLNSENNKIFEVNLEDSSIFNIAEIIKNLFPVIFIIPGGSELTKSELALELLKSLGVANSEISVLFRLPNETGENFNNFVKNNQLNNPLNEQIKAVFISGKISKPILESKINFNSVVNFSEYNVHYTIREFIRSHKNVIHINDHKSQRRLNLGFV
jgi:hypothetical protein